MIRDYRDGDAEAAGELLATHSPWLYTAAGLRHRLRALPERAHRRTWIAQTGRAAVAWCEAEFDWTAERSDIGRVYVLVHRDHRGRGLGSRLFELGVAHLLAHGATELRSWTFPESDAFLERRGFSRARVERLSALDPATVDTRALDAVPADVAVVPLASVAGRERDLYDLFAEAIADMPSDHPETNLSYDEFVEETLGDPTVSRDGSHVVLVGDDVASLSWVGVDLDRRVAEQHLTGTKRAHRRRGLARLAKLAVIRWCAEAGIGRLTTGNDATNVGMLAINAELGFRPFAEETEWVKAVA